MFDSIRVRSASNAALVLGYFQGEGLDKLSKGFDKDGAAAAALKRAEATGESGKIVETFSGKRRVLLVGLGKRDTFGAGNLRNVAAAVGRKLNAVKEAGAQVE